MGQLLSRKNAFRLLGKFTVERQIVQGEETCSPAETALVDALTMMNRIKKIGKASGNRFGKTEEKFFKDLKFIAASLGVLPSQEKYLELEKSMKVRLRMGTKVFSVFFTGGYRGKSIFIRELEKSEISIFLKLEETERKVLNESNLQVSC